MDYIIVGIGAYAKMLRRYLISTKNMDIVAFSVDATCISDDNIEGMPIISSEEILRKFTPDNTRLIMGIGYRNMNQIKEREFCRYKNMGYTFENYIHPTSIIEKNVEMGEGNNIFEGVIIQEGVKIGNANLIYGGAMIAHETVVGDYNSISVKACIAGCVEVRNNCFIGANSTIRDHIAISSYSLVGAGTYISKSTDEYEVVVAPKSVSLQGRNSLEFI